MLKCMLQKISYEQALQDRVQQTKKVQKTDYVVSQYKDDKKEEAQGSNEYCMYTI